jgi:hypothetical protein
MAAPFHCMHAELNYGLLDRLRRTLEQKCCYHCENRWRPLILSTLLFVLLREATDFNT